MSGRFGAEDLVANLPQSLAQGTTDRYTACSVSMCNRNTQPVKVGIAITSTVNAISGLEYIDKDVELLPNTVLERTGIAIKKGQYITVVSDGARISATAWGVSAGDPDSSVVAIPSASGFSEAVAGNLTGLGVGITTVGNAYNSGPALSFDGTSTAFYEKRFSTPLNASTNRWSCETIFKPNASMFTPGSEDKGIISHIGAVENSTGAELLTYAYQTFINSSDYKTISLRRGSGAGGGNWTSTGQNYATEQDDWIYWKTWYNGTAWRNYIFNIDTATVIQDGTSGVDPESGDHVGFVMGKAHFGNAQLFSNGSPINFSGQIAMMRVTGNGGINSTPSSVPNYTSADKTSDDLVFFVKNS
jgi:hypothetical protein|tara:strand:+ start:1873 stop:2949 length:1077 start_codon:yes stop_codon:yes gene_type:complete